MGREILFKAKSGVSGKWVEGLVLMQVIYNIFIPSRNQTAADRKYMWLIRIRSASTLDSRIRMERRSGRMISLCAMIIRLIS